MTQRLHSNCKPEGSAEPASTDEACQMEAALKGMDQPARNAPPYPFAYKASQILHDSWQIANHDEMPESLMLV